jgi:hypothetical protein
MKLTGTDAAHDASHRRSLSLVRRPGATRFWCGVRDEDHERQGWLSFRSRNGRAAAL